MMHVASIRSLRTECSKLGSGPYQNSGITLTEKNNPADDASRGLSPKDLLHSSRWLQGPSFLWEHRGNWNDFGKGEAKPLQLDDKEVKKASSLVTAVSNKEQFVALLQRLENFSS